MTEPIEPISTPASREADDNKSFPSAVDKFTAKVTEARGSKVQDRATALETKFTEKYGESIVDSLNGSPSNATKAHGFLFEEAIGETDADIRKDTTLAHILLELKYNKQDRAKTFRGKPIQEDPRIDFYQEGMLQSGQELVKSSQGDRLRVNTEELTDAFSRFDALYDQFYQIYGGERSSQLPEGLTARQLAVVLAAQQTAIEYFGDPNDHAESQNEQMYTKAEGRTRTLEDFKGTTSAVCTEYAALAQQLMAFAGERSDLISGIVSFCDSQSVAEGNPTGAPLVHAYNLFYTNSTANEGSVFIFDPSNPVIETDTSDPTVQKRRLYLVPLTPGQWEGFRKDIGNTYLQYKGTHRFYSLT